LFCNLKDKTCVQTCRVAVRRAQIDPLEDTRKGRQLECYHSSYRAIKTVSSTWNNANVFRLFQDRCRYFIKLLCECSSILPKQDDGKKIGLFFRIRLLIFCLVFIRFHLFSFTIWSKQQ